MMTITFPYPMRTSTITTLLFSWAVALSIASMTASPIGTIADRLAPPPAMVIVSCAERGAQGFPADPSRDDDFWRTGWCLEPERPTLEV